MNQHETHSLPYLAKPYISVSYRERNRMNKILAVLAVALFSAGAYAEELNVTFGAGSDLAAK